jgi:hypothetical protein
MQSKLIPRADLHISAPLLFKVLVGAVLKESSMWQLAVQDMIAYMQACQGAV